MATKKEVVKRAISFEEVHPVPYWIDFTPGAHRRLQEHLNKDHLGAFLGNYVIDVFANSCHGVVPDELQGDTWEDDFGVVWKGATVDRGAPFDHPLGSAPSLKGYEFPDPDDARRFNHLNKFLTDNSDLFTVVSLDFGLLFERAWYLRGMTNLLTDLHLNPAFVEELLDHLVDFYLKSIENISCFNGLDAVCLIDDYGTQQGLVMAPEMWRRFIKPRLAIIVDVLAKYHLIPYLHCCGNVSDIIADFIDVGIKLLDPLQPEIMDLQDVKDKFGKQLTLLGGFSTQQIIPYGTENDVRKHIRDCLEVLGKGGGYIAFNGIPLQTDVPLENILAIIDTLRNQ